MKALPPIAILIFALFFIACAPKVVKPPEKPAPTPKEAQAALFSKAEALYASQDVENALAAYQDCVDRFPDAPLAADALMRIGAIHRGMGNPKDAFDAYSQVLSQYPQSRRGVDAQLEILSLLYDQGAYDQVIIRADGVLDHPVTTENIFRVYSILGEAYRASGKPEEAVRAYSAAGRFAPDDKRAAAIEKLKAAMEDLDLNGVVSLLGYLDDPLSRGYLLFRLGSEYLKADQYHEAMMTLSEFVDLYPDHERAPEARTLVDMLQKQTGTSRFLIGCLLPISGPSSAFGLQALEGLEFALNRFYAGDTSSSIELIVKDTASDPAKAVAAVRELAEQNAAAIIGPIFTAAAAAAEAQQHEIPMITITQKSDITQYGDYIFRNFFTPGMQVKALVAYAIENMGLSRFAILYPDEKYGQTFMNLFWDEVISRGASVVGAESYKKTHTDFAEPIKKLAGLYYSTPKRGKQGDPVTVDFEGLFIPDSPRRVGLITPQLAYNDITDVYLFGTNLWHSERLVTMARPYVQGAVMPDIFFAGSQNPLVKEFVAGFSDVYGRSPSFIEAVLYDTAMMLFQVLNESGPGFRFSIRNKLLELKNVAGVTGFTSFGEDGDARKSLYLLKIKGDRFVEVVEP